MVERLGFRRVGVDGREGERHVERDTGQECVQIVDTGRLMEVDFFVLHRARCARTAIFCCCPKLLMYRRRHRTPTPLGVRMGSIGAGSGTLLYLSTGRNLSCETPISGSRKVLPARGAILMVPLQGYPCFRRFRHVRFRVSAAIVIVLHPLTRGLLNSMELSRMTR